MTVYQDYLALYLYTSY